MFAASRPRTRLNRAIFVTSATSTTSTVVIPAAAAVGDIAILFDGAINASGIPTDVLPTGFTASGGTGALTMRVKGSRKILVGGDPGATVTGLNGTSVNNKIMLIFRPTSGAFGVTNVGSLAEVIATDPSAQVTLASAQTPPLLVAAYYRCDAALATPTFSVTADATITNGANAKVSYKYYESAPADVTADLGDGGTLNGLLTFWLELF